MDHPFEEDHFSRDQTDAGLTQPFESDLLVLAMARTHGIDGNPAIVAGSRDSQGRLEDANVCLHPGHDHLGAARAAEDLGQRCLVHGRKMALGDDLGGVHHLHEERQGGADRLGAVLGSHNRHPQFPGPFGQGQATGEDVLMPFDAGSQARLHIHHEEEGTLCSQSFQFEGFFPVGHRVSSVHRAGGPVPR